MTLVDIVGILSAAITVFAFVGNQYGKIKTDSVWYDGMNFFGALGLLSYAISYGAIPFMITNGVWALVSGLDVLKYFLNKRA